MRTILIITAAIFCMQIYPQDRMEQQKRIMAAQTLIPRLKKESDSRITAGINQNGGKKPNIDLDTIKPEYENIVRELISLRGQMLKDAEAIRDKHLQDYERYYLRGNQASADRRIEYLKNIEPKIVEIYTNPWAGLQSNKLDSKINVGDIGILDGRKVKVFQIINKEVAIVDWKKDIQYAVTTSLGRIGGGGHTAVRTRKEPQHVFLEINTERLHDGATMTMDGVWYFHRNETYDTVAGGQRTLVLGKRIEFEDIFVKE